MAGLMKSSWIISLALLAQVCSAQQLSSNPTFFTCGANSPAISASGNSSVSVILKDAVCDKAEREPHSAGRRAVVLTAYLEPIPHFFITAYGLYANNLAEQTQLKFKLLNISDKAILITGASFRIMGNAEIGGGVVGGVSTLSESIRASGVTLLQPGEIREFSISRLVKLRGIAAEIANRNWIKDAIISDVGNGESPFLHNTNLVKELNAILKSKYGDTYFAVTIYEKDYNPLTVISFPLADGADIFYSQPLSPKNRKVRTQMVKFDHSRFLAYAITDARKQGVGVKPAPISPEQAE